MAFTAFSAGIDDHPVLGRAAGGDRMDDLAMLTRHGMREAADIFGSVVVEKISLMAPMSQPLHDRVDNGLGLFAALGGEVQVDQEVSRLLCPRILWMTRKLTPASRRVA